MQTGFTLAEILVVIALTGILGAMVYPDLTGFFGIQKIDTAVGEVALGILYAQSASIKGSMHQARFHEDDEWMRVYDCLTDSDGNGDRCSDGDDVIADEPLSRGHRSYEIDFSDYDRLAGVSIASAEFGGSTSAPVGVAFDELGIPSESGNVVQQFGDQCRRISVSSIAGLVETSVVACPEEEEVEVGG